MPIRILSLCVLGFSAALMSGCAGTSRRACPADKPVDLANAIDLAEKAARAYLPDAEILAACGTDQCVVLEGATTGARAFVQRDDSNMRQWVAFRGTQTVEDVKLDARYVHVTDTVLGMPLHEGFFAGATELLPGLRENLRPGYQTQLTGHSLGGAMAVIAALKLKTEENIEAHTVTFGQPKVTSAAGARKADSLLKLTRFARPKDVVPQLPPVSWKSGWSAGTYAHFGREVVLDDSGFTCREGYGSGFSGVSFWKDRLSLEDLEEHRMTGYHELVGTLRSRYSAGPTDEQ